MFDEGDNEVTINLPERKLYGKREKAEETSQEIEDNPISDFLKSEPMDDFESTELSHEKGIYIFLNIFRRFFFQQFFLT